MADRLVQLSANPTAKRLITTLGLPIPMPTPLRRDAMPWTERPLHDRTVVLGGLGELTDTLADLVARSGGNPHVVLPEGTDLPAAFTAAGEAWGRPAVALTGEELSSDRAHVVLFDATGLQSPADLRQIYDFFHPRMRHIHKCSRLIVLGRPHGAIKGIGHAAAQRSLEGFVKSLGREVGRKGATATLVTVQKGAEERLAPVLRFFTSDRAAYVSGQVVRVTKTVRATDDAAIRPLEGKVALVTGSARGIGAATARTLAREGAKVIVLDIPPSDAEASAVAAEIGGSVLLADITAPDAPQTIAAYVKERFGTIDIVIHNAGVTRDKTLAKMKPEWWDMAINVNLDAVVRLTSALEPLMNSHGRIVCLSSIAGIAGNVGQTNYSCSKAGVIGFVEAAAPKLAKRGIAVNAVAPGFIETRLTHAIPVATREVARRLCNLSQGGLPQDVAEVLTFLSSPGAAAMSGQILRVCGGSFVGA